MDWTTFCSSPKFDMDCLANEWSETQILFGHDWSETEMAYGELNPSMAQAQSYPQSQLFWPLGNLQSESTSDFFPYQDPLLQSGQATQELSASWNFSTPVSSTPSANSDEYDYYYESNGIPEMPRATSQPLPKATYTCETCGVRYLKRHLLK